MRKVMRKDLSKNMDSYPRDSNVCLSYDILRIVFSYLNGRDLSSAAMVCRSWLEDANKEQELRGPQCFIKQYYNSIEQKLTFDCIKQSTIRPSIGFFFLPYKTSKLFYNYARGLICKALPKNCKAIMLFTHTIIPNNEVNPSPNMCVLFPQIPNVKISMVEVTEISLKLFPEVPLIGCFSVDQHEKNTFYPVTALEYPFDPYRDNGYSTTYDTYIWLIYRENVMAVCDMNSILLRTTVFYYIILY